jgi:hypothetical protein
VTDALTILADSPQRRYLPDLIVRHATATKSQSARIAGNAVDHLNQLGTIRLEKLPVKSKSGERYKSSPIKSGKTVLIVDDICTEGNSFESARALIEKARANCILLAWLKTINKDYHAISGSLPISNPFSPVTPSSVKVPTKVDQEQFGHGRLGQCFQKILRVGLAKVVRNGQHCTDARACRTFCNRPRHCQRGGPREPRYFS